MRPTPTLRTIIDAADDDELWSIRDYFWFVGSGLADHSRETWASFRAGYAAMAAANIRFDPPRAPRHRAA